MNIDYTPFLKLKDNELVALENLDSKWHKHLVPFFDFPSKQDSKKPSDYAKKSEEMAKKLKQKLPEFQRFYIDTFDIEDHMILGKHNYLYLLEQFDTFTAIPVTGPDRTDDHKESIKTFMSKNPDSANIIAYRVTYEDFISYTATNEEVKESLDELMNDLFTEVHLIMDCRLVALFNDKDINATVSQITDYVRKFTGDYRVTKVIVCGSMIPISLASLVKPNCYDVIERIELQIYQNVKANFSDSHDIQLGDYTTVSPEFAEPNPDSARNATSKLVYPHEQTQHIWRGTKVISKPSKGYLYNQHVKDMIQLTPSIYRGPDFSWADGEFDAKQNARKGFWINSITKFLVNAHISYMLHIYSR
ncbi:beta family protein [Thiomicrorhabdus heinhorstiae]|uniref:T4 beta protein n=1 Tax=Thiomicrorhabdus heinhorstiae TaxID=2748010 RepID=A0ABS0BZ03_9GAMM|nr:hypothetical protein [Thiomicrorhabdus heinhorstiae]MBF6059021.1 hypothetical protein [Thiomicrorhabdus heinhorstiae]